MNKTELIKNLDFLIQEIQPEALKAVKLLDNLDTFNKEYQTIHQVMDDFDGYLNNDDPIDTLNNIFGYYTALNLVKRILKGEWND